MNLATARSTRSRRLAIAGGVALALLVSVVPSTRSIADRRPSTAGALVHRASLPVGFQPEGIDTDTIDGQPYAFLGSMANGSIYRLDLRTGTGITLAGPAPSASIGVESDHHGRLFVADGAGGTVNGDPGGGARVIDERTGAVLASYRFATGPVLINDVTVTKHAVYFTDTINPVIYELPLGPNGALPPASKFRAIAITGAYHFDDKASTVDGNGITPTPDGSALIVIQYRTGKLFRLNPSTGYTTPVNTYGRVFVEGDGLTVDGNHESSPVW